MRTLFCVRPATRNIGNDVINKATAELLYDAFGSGTGGASTSRPCKARSSAASRPDRSST